MAQADRLGPKVGSQLVLYAAFISPLLCNDDKSCYDKLEIDGVIIIIIIIIISNLQQLYKTANTDLPFSFHVKQLTHPA